MELTGTNRPRTCLQRACVRCAILEQQPGPRLCVGQGVAVLWGFGGDGGRETPGDIPNPVVKPSSADGTALGRVWESRSPPDVYESGEWGCPAPLIHFVFLVMKFLVMKDVFFRLSDR